MGSPGFRLNERAEYSGLKRIGNGEVSSGSGVSPECARAAKTGGTPVLLHTARISFSLWARTVSISLMYSSVLFWISFSACFRSSSVIFPSF